MKCFSGLLLALLLVPTSAAAQHHPILGATLYTAAPGPVTMQLLANTTPASLNWSLPLIWRTGPALHDYNSTGGNAPSCTSAGGVTSCTFSPPDLSGQFGQHLAGPAPSGWTNTAPGTVISSPALAAGTVTVFAAQMFSNFSPVPNVGFTQRDLVYTGGYPPDFAFERLVRPAAVFAGENATAWIGYTTSASSPLSMNFLDYSIRILVSNVCVKE